MFYYRFFFGWYNYFEWVYSSNSVVWVEEKRKNTQEREKRVRKYKTQGNHILG
jgi:hypothetical protein